TNKCTKTKRGQHPRLPMRPFGVQRLYGTKAGAKETLFADLFCNFRQARSLDKPAKREQHPLCFWPEQSPSRDRKHRQLPRAEAPWGFGSGRCLLPVSLPRGLREAAI